jgi:hypothetical protein
MLWIKYNCTKYNTSTNQRDYTCNNKITYSNRAGQVIWLQYNCSKYNTTTVQCDYTETINELILNYHYKFSDHNTTLQIITTQ